MKLAKVAIVCAAFASAAAYAESASNALGVLKVDNGNSLKIVPVAVNFQNADGTAVSVAKAVKTAGLPEGTLLYAFDSAAQKYVVYAIDGAGWKAQETFYFDGRTMTEVAVASPDEKTLPAGTAVFVKFPDSYSSEVPAIYTAGAVASGERLAVTPGANLCSFPVGKAVDLNAAQNAANYAPPVKASPVASTFLNEAKTRLSTVGDTIVVPKTDNGGCTVYYYDGSKWGYIGKVEGVKSFVTTGVVIPGGLGFWYNSVSSVED